MGSGGCSVYWVFHTNSVVFRMTFPNIYHVIPRCTRDTLQCTEHPRCVLMQGDHIGLTLVRGFLLQRPSLARPVDGFGTSYPGYIRLRLEYSFFSYRPLMNVSTKSKIRKKPKETCSLPCFSLHKISDINFIFLVSILGTIHFL